jgi:hypothetical protein
MRLYGRKGQYSTITEHMPKDHQEYLEWNGERFRKWAERIGKNTAKVIDSILRSKRVEQQSYRACMGLLKLAEKHTPQKLEAACEKALQYSSSPSYKSVNNIIVNLRQDVSASDTSAEKKTNSYGITRGAGYYGGNRK